MTDGPRIAALAIYPVKSCRGIPLDRAVLTERGLRHDRRWMIVDEAGRLRTQRELPRLATLRTAIDGDRLLLGFGDEQAALPVDDAGEPMTVTVWRDTVEAVRPDPGLDARLSDWLGRPVRLVRFPRAARRPCNPIYAPAGAHTGFADGYPVLVTGEGSLAELNEALRERDAEPVPMGRFRPNLVLAGVPPRAEDRHRRLELGGGAALDLVKPCGRCVVPTIDQETGERHPSEPVATLRNIRLDPVTREILFGQNAVPVLPAGEAVLRVGQPVTLARPV
ncbi:MAG TPA: MOSC domain-containing protein [Geminicoccaceae bacterium]|nr:MOSC domain-containing protein [Geminicoccus sp.]HMU53276.1 MOSC domain-containing protein [Geminicoccaceae bacterium]